MASRMSEIGMSAMRASEVGMRHSAANLQMIAGTVANKAHVIATILSRSSKRVRRKNKVKTVPTEKAEDDTSPMSQYDEVQLADSETDVSNVEPETSPRSQQQKKKSEQEKELVPLLPWEEYTEDGAAKENVIVKQKIFELAIYRRTFVEPAEGEEEYTFNFDTFKTVARELLLSDPNLREKRETLVESVPVAVISEDIFWRNFFLRCNAVRLAEDMPSYLPEAEQTPVFTIPLSRLKRGLLCKPRLLTPSSKSRRLVVGYSASSESDNSLPSDDDLSGLELDVDGEIEKELVKRRPSRAMEICVQSEPVFQVKRKT